MQSSCYQHGGNHDKTFTALDKSVDAANKFNLYEINWSATSVTIKVNGKTVRTVSGSSNVPQKPMHVRLHSRSIGYSEMGDDSTFSSYIESFQFIPAAKASSADGGVRMKCDSVAGSCMGDCESGTACSSMGGYCACTTCYEGSKAFCSCKQLLEKHIIKSLANCTMDAKVIACKMKTCINPTSSELNVVGLESKVTNI